MSLSYKFDRKNNDSDKTENPANKEDEKEIVNFNFPGSVRNLCLKEISGKQTFLNYAYLMSGEFSPDENSIFLYFTTHTVELKGNNLEKLFDSLNLHEPRKIECLDKRYITIKSETEIFITEILISNNKDY